MPSAPLAGPEPQPSHPSSGGSPPSVPPVPPPTAEEFDAPVYRAWLQPLLFLFGATAMIAAVVLNKTPLPGTLLVSMELLGFVVFLVSLAPGRVGVGADGIHQRWLGWRRFTAWSEITKVYLRGSYQVVLERRSGRKIVLTNRAFAQPVFSAYDAFTKRTRGPDMDGRFGRGARGAREWLSSVREAIALGTGEYRVAEVREQDLWRVVYDPTALETTRIGEAIALREQGAHECLSRIRQVADSCVAPRMRAVFSKVADSACDDDLVSVLEELEDEVSSRGLR
jgi:hypothetical protein